MTKNTFVTFSMAITLMFLGAMSQNAQAQRVTVGAQVGGVGGVSNDSAIASGLNININSLGWASFYADFVMAPFAAGTFTAISPAFAFYPVDVEGFLFGGLVGVGFYNVPGDSSNFGFHYGIVGDFSVSKRFSVGMTARQHLLTGGSKDSLWNVMMSLGYTFDGGGDW
jgi:hypothetical protein